MGFKVSWADSGREPRCAPNPDYPAGIDLDCSLGAARSCKADLPYPAKRCGLYVVTCEACGMTVAATTSGRADDPKSLRMACKEVLQ